MRLFKRCSRCGLIRLCDVTEGEPVLCDECLGREAPEPPEPS